MFSKNSTLERVVIAITLSTAACAGSGNYVAVWANSGAKFERNLGGPDEERNWMIDLDQQRILDKKAYRAKLERLRVKIEGSLNKNASKIDEAEEQKLAKLFTLYRALGLTDKINAMAARLHKLDTRISNFILLDFYTSPADRAKLVAILKRLYALDAKLPRCATLIRIADLYYQLNKMDAAEEFYKRAYSIATAPPVGAPPYSVEIGAINSYACFLAERGQVADAGKIAEKAFAHFDDGSSLSSGYGGFDNFGTFLSIVKSKDPPLYAKLHKLWSREISKQAGTGVIAVSGKELTPPIFGSVGKFSEGLAVAKDRLTCRYGYIDKAGRWALQPTYIEANPFDKGLATAVVAPDLLPINVSGQYVDFSIINRKGGIVKTIPYSYAGAFEGDIFIATRSSLSLGTNHPVDIIDRTGERLFSGVFDMLERNGNHYSIFMPTHYKYGGCVQRNFGFMLSFKIVPQVSRPGHFQLVQENGSPVKAVGLQEQENFIFENIVRARQVQNDKCHINSSSTGAVLQDNAMTRQSKEYYQIERLNSNCFKVTDSTGRSGLIDASGKELVPPRYNNIRAMHDGLAAFQKGEKWGFVNGRGVEVVPARYEEVGDFHEGLSFYKRK